MNTRFYKVADPYSRRADEIGLMIRRVEDVANNIDKVELRFKDNYTAWFDIYLTLPYHGQGYLTTRKEEMVKKEWYNKLKKAEYLDTDSRLYKLHHPDFSKREIDEAWK